MRNLFLAVSLILIGCLTMGAAPANPTVEITVSKGDRLVNIMERYLENPRRWPEIARINHLRNPDMIYPGRKLNIPVDLLKRLSLNGQVTFIKGEALLYDPMNRKWEPLHPGERITQGGWVRTGEQSGLEIAFEDSDTVFLGSNTQIALISAEKRGLLHRFYEIRQEIGNAFSRIRKILGQESRYEVQTPAAVAAIRGTEFRIAVDPEQTTRCEVLEGTVGVANQAARVDVKEMEGTIVRKGAPPLNPRKLLPPPAWATGKDHYNKLPLALGFERVTGASKYRVIISKDEGAKDTIRDVVLSPEEPLLVEGLEDGTYFLSSLSIDEVGLEGPASAGAPLRIRTNPVAPFIQTPVQDEEYVKKRLDFRWLKVRDAEKYHFQVAEDPEFQTIRMEQKDLTVTEYTSAPLDYQGYYFRVRSIAADGYEGAWSDGLPFKVVPPPPSPTLEKPAVEKDQIYFRWPNPGANLTYHFQMSQDEGFQKIVVDQRVAQPELRLKKPAQSGTYYVRTSSISPQGKEGEFSRPQTFEVEEEFPFAAVGVLIPALIFLLLL